MWQCEIVQYLECGCRVMWCVRHRATAKERAIDGTVFMLSERLRHLESLPGQSGDVSSAGTDESACLFLSLGYQGARHGRATDVVAHARGGGVGGGTLETVSSTSFS